MNNLQPDSHKTNKQINRFKTIIQQWTNALKEGKEVIVLMDSNIDTLTDSTHNKTHKITTIQNILLEHINTYNLTIHNDKPTHFPPRRAVSCIDHIITNTPNKILNTTTHKNSMSDHAYLTTKYMTKEQIYTPKFISLRDNRQLTKQNLKICIDLNQNFKNIVKFNHPNDIANSLQIELNTIINTVAPSRIVQFKKDHQPYINSEISTILQESNSLLNNAINTNEFEDWVKFKNFRNNTQKIVNNAKTQYTTNKTNNSYNKWKTVKNINNVKQ